MLTVSQFQQIFPSAKTANTYVPLLNELLPQYGVTTKHEIAAFLSQVGHESGSFNRMVEGLNYSAHGLAATWPKRYSTGNKVTVNGKKVPEPNTLALSLHRRPEAIANNVYANRLGNGNEQSGDGWLYRGRGLLQNTGKHNYTVCTKKTGIDFVNHPELMELPRNALISALCFWDTNNLDLLDDRISDTEKLTEAVNGGRNGLEERKHILELALSILG